MDADNDNQRMNSTAKDHDDTQEDGEEAPLPVEDPPSTINESQHSQQRSSSDANEQSHVQLSKVANGEASTTSTTTASSSTQWCCGCSYKWWLVYSFLGLVLIAVSAFAELILIVSIFFRSSPPLGGSSGFHGIAMISIMIIWAAILFGYLGFLAIKRRNQRRRSVKDTGVEEPRTHEIATNQEGKTFCNDHGFYLSRAIWLFTRLLLPLTVILLVLTEVLFYTVMPRNSIIPLKPGQNALEATTNEYVPEGCPFKKRFQKAKDFYANNTCIDWDKIMVLYAGNASPSGGGQPSAYVFDQTIHIKEGLCPDSSLLVHELVHIYQEQIGYWYGPGGPGKAFKYFADRWRCASCLYDFGRYGGVRSKYEQALAGDKDAANVHKAFGIEQVASLVELYYADKDWCTQYREREDCEALEFYANQIIIC